MNSRTSSFRLATLLLTLAALDRPAFADIAQQAYLKASNNHGFQFYGPNFGHTVAVSGGLTLVGADGENSNARGVNGNQYNDLAINSGAAYLFTGLGYPPPQLVLMPCA
jgi:hypothetical protein